jgi:glycosyltransferase involved in cell wall biosynthesis
MKVRVLVLAYNHERYIAQALDSVLMQETDFDYEIVVLEDCSTDGTREILLRYQKQYPRKIRLRLAERNECSNKPFAEEIEAAPTPYIAMLDGDDYWTSPKKLQKQVEFLRAHPECVLCFHNALTIYEDGRVSHPYNVVNQKPFSVLEDLWQCCFIAGATPMFRKDVLGKFPEWYYTMSVGDWPLYVLCAQHGKIGYMDELLAVYRIHGEGLWSKQDKICQLESLIAIYESMNANLRFRYTDTAQLMISKRKNELTLARRVTEIAAAVLPPKASVIVISPPYEELPRFDARRVWAFPERIRRDTRRGFASGAAGRREAPWIGPRGTYKFCLYGGRTQETLLASVSVTGKYALALSRSGEAPARNEAFIAATPNPVPMGSGPGKIGKTVISWSTGDGLPGTVYVSVEDQQMHYPANDAAAVEEMEQLLSKGAEFLLVPHNSFKLFKRYPELKGHLNKHYRLLASEKDICLIYDLREALPTACAQHAESLEVGFPLVLKGNSNQGL